MVQGYISDHVSMDGHTEYSEHVDLEACRWVENQFAFHSYLGPGFDEYLNIFSGCTYKVGQEKIEKSGAWVYSMIFPQGGAPQWCLLVYKPH